MHEAGVSAGAGLELHDTTVGIANLPAHLRVAVLIPCLDEVATVGRVIADFRAALPRAQIHVFDNGSRDGTPDAARAASARVCEVFPRGKGHVVRRMFADIEADVYVLVDGDATYAAERAGELVSMVALEGCDMAVAERVPSTPNAFRPAHAWGNRALTRFIGWLFGRRCVDVLSGYRALSRRFVKSFPIHGTGWEIESEMCVHALQLRMPTAALPSEYRPRPPGSQSKLNTWGDGAWIGWRMLSLFVYERPLSFYGLIALSAASVALLLAWPVLATFVETGLVPRFPTAILATGLMILAALAFAVGLTLDAMTKARREMRLLAYLAEQGPQAADREKT